MRLSRLKRMETLYIKECSLSKYKVEHIALLRLKNGPHFHAKDEWNSNIN
ncbi:hypothetical protein Sjap_014123 [Stephania japonica]|uniref:Uncharacterized protein n=1 Tax=Stephania japonica TaxID=461633 RepID=A0AAP0IZ83_9MAGN